LNLVQPLGSHAVRYQETGSGGFVAILVIGILLALFALAILTNFGGVRDGHASRIRRQRARSGIGDPPSSSSITVWQIVIAIAFLSFALFMISSAIANLI
jgi:hypothetical protein